MYFELWLNFQDNTVVLYLRPIVTIDHLDGIQTTLNVGDELEVFFLDEIWMIPIATVAVSTQNVWYEPEGFLMTGPKGWHVEHMLVQQRVISALRPG